MDLAGFLVLCAAGCYAYGSLIEPRLLRRTDRQIVVPNLPPSLDGLSILLLSDFHTTKWGYLESRVLSIIEHCQYDLMILAGDYANSSTGVEPFMTLVREASPRLGAFAVKGNTEHKTDIKKLWPNLRGSLCDAGVTVLEDKALSFTPCGRSSNIWIGGVEDHHLQKRDIAHVLPPQDFDGFKLLISHSPDVLQDEHCSQYDLILCGHTHGGQFRLPYSPPIYSHTRIGSWAADGLVSPEVIASRLKRKLPQPALYVSRGIGTVGRGPIWVRFGCPPEVCLLTLQCAADKSVGVGETAI